MIYDSKSILARANEYEAFLNQVYGGGTIVTMGEVFASCVVYLTSTSGYRTIPHRETKGMFTGIYQWNQKCRITLWGQTDKALHFICGGLFASGEDPGQFEYAVDAASMKEESDAKRGGIYDLNDYAATIIGAAFAWRLCMGDDKLATRIKAGEVSPEKMETNYNNPPAGGFPDQSELRRITDENKKKVSP